MRRREFLAAAGRVVIAPAVAGLAGCSGRPPKTTSVATPKVQSPRAAASVQVTRSPISFKDVTSAAGIHFQHSNGGTGHRYYLETVGAGCAFFDYDNDGWLDIFAVQSGPIPHVGKGAPPKNALYRNNRDGTFTDVTDRAGLGRPAGYGQGVAVADFNNDGHKDLLVTSYGEVHLYRNNGDGTFTDVTAASGLAAGKPKTTWYSSAAWADYDHDGYLDLFICCYVKWRPETDLDCPQPNGQPRGTCPPQVYDPERSILYHNNGDGTFTDVSARSGIGKLPTKALGAAWVDYDDDGWDDLLIANDGIPNLLFKNNRDGTFSNVAADAGAAYGDSGDVYNGMGIALADTRHSGREDIVITNFAGQPKTVLYNLGGGTFSNATFQSRIGTTSRERLGFGCAFLDYDNDGWADLVVANGHVSDLASKYGINLTYQQANQLFHNQGNGVFVEDAASLGDLAVPGVGRGLAVGDFNNDGAPDVLISHMNGPLSLYENRGGAQQNWICLRFEGVHSNRDGVGTKVWARAGKTEQYAEVRSGSSYCSHNSERLLFGLGEHALVDQVRVRWPSGRTESVGPLIARHFYLLREGAGGGKDPRLEKGHLPGTV